MYKEEIIKSLNNNIKKKGIKIAIDEKMMNVLAMDVSRIADKKITIIINELKKDFKLKIDDIQKEKIRKYLLGYPIELDFSIENYELEKNDEEISKAYSFLKEGFRRNENIMVESLISRIKKFFFDKSDTTKEYMEYIKKNQKNKNQLIIIEIDKNRNYTSDNIAEIIKLKYNSLSNFHYAILIFKNNDKLVNWEQISEISIFMEYFKKEKNFKLFEKKNKRNRINELTQFLKRNSHIEYTDTLGKTIEKFYDSVRYGFQFEDLLISDDGEIQVLIMQKVELDERPKKCPVCLKEEVRGNSYPKLLYKSFECQNPRCSARSKIGRGKRYDFYGAKRQIMLQRNSELDKINDEIYFNLRRDVFEKKFFSIEQLILLYSWHGDSIEIINSTFNKQSYMGRKIINEEILKFENRKIIEKLSIFELFRKINKSVCFKKEYKVLDKFEYKNSYIYNGSSTDLLPFIDKISKVLNYSGAITSPPYYNARDYSKWDNLFCYLIDMMINAKAVSKKLKKEGIYIYNIGDVVDQDNIYIKSNMSRRRQMLGFFSIFIFKIVGYKAIGNIIWDKGEVQSKRNSTANHISGYIKPINAYEHCIVFSKDKDRLIIPTEIKKIESVKKINSKGENILGHTAPYPLELAKLIINFVKKDDYIIDPFLGSGSTVIAMKEEGYNSIGFELNEKYFLLSQKRIMEYFENQKIRLF